MVRCKRVGNESTSFTYLVDIGVIGIIVAVKHVPSFSAAIVVDKFASVRVFNVVGDTWLADTELCKGIVPTLHRLLEGVAAEIIVIIISATAVVPKEIAQDVFDRDGVVAGGGLIFGDAPCVGVQAHFDVTTLHRLDVVVDFGSIAGRCVGVNAPLRPGLSCVLHKGVFLVVPDANALVFEELFHPIVVRLVLEESKQGEMGVVQMAIHFGASAASARLASGLLPLVLGHIEILVFSDTTALIIQIDVLKKKNWKEEQLQNVSQRWNGSCTNYPQGKLEKLTAAQSTYRAHPSSVPWSPLPWS